MGLSAGLVGLPNVGKSTIFNAISSGQVAAENYPFCTIDPNQGIVEIPDKRLKDITAIRPTKKEIPAVMELVDIAGLVKGASNGDGLGNQFLGHIKNVDAIVHVVRCFEDPDVIHVDKNIDPLRDVQTIETELMLADIDTVERGIKRLEKQSRSGNKDIMRQIEVFKEAKKLLNNGIMIKNGIKDEEKLLDLRELFLLSAKPVIYVANVDESQLDKDNSIVKTLYKHAESTNSGCITLCGKVESELIELSIEEQNEFLESMGLSESGLHTMAREVYKTLGLQTFFTVGKDENKAWTIKVGASAPQAAGVIHTDFEKGFIKAEVYSFDDFMKYKSEATLRDVGKIRQEGKTYIVQDGDIMFFKFSN